jgi:ATP-dependent Clp protease ATP-binding subunit ClpA
VPDPSPAPPPRVLDLAAEEARLLNHYFVGTQHLLLAVTQGDSGAAQVLRQMGITYDAVRTRIQPGVPLQSGVPSSRPPAARPVTPRTKKVLELSLRESLQLGHNYIASDHILLGILGEGQGSAIRILTDLGVVPADLRERVVACLAEERGGGQPHPTCPHCHAHLSESARARRLELDDAAGARHPFTVLYCNACGRSLAFKPIN